MTTAEIKALTAACRAQIVAVVPVLNGSRYFLNDEFRAVLEALPVQTSNRLARRGGFFRFKGSAAVKIVVNTRVCSTPERFTSTLLHEFAHAAALLLKGSNAQHGPVWVAVMKALGRPAERCHSYDLAGMPGLVALACRCQIHHLTPRKAASIAARPHTYTCVRCKAHLFPAPKGPEGPVVRPTPSLFR